MTNVYSKNEKKIDTTLAHAGRSPRDFHGFVNPPVVHASTILFPDVETMATGKQTYTYGRRGTPTTDALEAAVAELEGAAGVKLANSGLNAIALACLSCLKAGDHLLVPDSAYGPTRHFADTVLPIYGVQVEYYDPSLDGAVRQHFKPNTSAVFVEAPGSLTFEMQDTPAIVEAAQTVGATVLMDNTWASPLYCQPIPMGVDLSIQAGTKYIVGHSDVMLGTIAASERAWPSLDRIYGAMGVSVGPDDVYLALRGLRTLSVRLERHMKNTLEVIGWLKDRDEVANIRYPALESDPGHDIWKRDFSGASGLFGFDFKNGTTKDQSNAFFNALSLFGLGYSWGGFESLAIPVRLKGARTVNLPDPNQLSTRLHIGLEDPEDLIRDLGQALDKALS
ncbi:cystathionine beta-lyase [Roseibium hamelinense]|uniref:Cystathionine beta-lyase n=1 Tax=Roseibium hamelinense TaxID=150831 RepID=A0A562TGQ7_9HYPH|nr:cystathionine beta-lyase [Roseibium hamelinense]MTI46075.1 cystathionine beta-lyase [Roseibium hamelinense]TWI92732.1 cystathionine beta-lyase [Roseibium hamelinense]